MNNQKKALAALGVDDASRPRQPGSFDGSMVSPLAPVAARPAPKPDPTRAGWNPKASSNPVKTGLKSPAVKIAALKSERLAAAPGFDPGPRPEMRWLEVDLLDVDHAYQRMLSGKHAKRLAAAFKWAAFQPLTVTPTAGARYAVIDGQHRLQAARAIVQVVELPCYIVPKVDQRGQAAAFLDVNNSHKQVSALEKFRAGLVAGDKAICEVDRILKAAGVTMVSGKPQKPMTTASVSTLLRMHRTHGAAVLTGALVAIGTAWPTEREAFMEQYITALCVILHYGTPLPGKAVSVLRNIKPTKFLADQIMAGKEAGRHGSAMVLAELYRRITGKEFKR